MPACKYEYFVLHFRFALYTLSLHFVSGGKHLTALWARGRSILTVLTASASCCCCCSCGCRCRFRITHLSERRLSVKCKLNVYRGLCHNHRWIDAEFHFIETPSEDCHSLQLAACNLSATPPLRYATACSSRRMTAASCFDALSCNFVKNVSNRFRWFIAKFISTL